ncbi:MAG: nuclear transport factor 2 family protein [Actinomycetota bacterium]|nr:nuclear transport factor 2 family protein [Actinomycetota bacterium]
MIIVSGQRARREEDLRSAIDAMDRAFSAGNLDDFLAHFSEHAQLLLHEQEPVKGIDAIRDAFATVFDTLDTSAYRPSYEVMDAHDDHAYVLGSFHEVLRARDGTSAIQVRGRVVQFWHRRQGSWRIVRLLTARSAPDEVQNLA